MEAAELGELGTSSLEASMDLDLEWFNLGGKTGVSQGDIAASLESSLSGTTSLNSRFRQKFHLKHAKYIHSKIFLNALQLGVSKLI